MSDPVYQFRRGLPAHVWSSLGNNQLAAAHVIKAVERGWTVRQLIDACSDLAQVANPGGALLHRLQRCAAIDKQPRTIPPWCGQCDRTTRHLLDHNRLPGPERCPACHWKAARTPQRSDEDIE